MAEYATFAKFYNLEEAQALLSLLKENNIEYTLGQERNQLDGIIIGNTMDPMLTVAIPVEQFREATELMKNISAAGPSLTQDPEHLDAKWIILGYILSLLVFVGLFFGLTIVTASKRLSDGRKVRIYDRYTIRHGRIMLLIAAIATAFWLINKFLQTDLI